MHNLSPPFAFLANRTGAAKREKDSFIQPFAKIGYLPYIRSPVTRSIHPFSMVGGPLSPIH